MTATGPTQDQVAAVTEDQKLDHRETDLERRRYDRIAWLYEAMQYPAEALTQRRLRGRLFDAVPRDGDLLEVGVGTGLNLPFYPPQVRATAIDLSPRMLDRARRRARRLGLDINLRVADAQRLPFDDDSFDCVVSTFVFCSVPDPVVGLRELGRVCRPDGHVLLAEHVRPEGSLAGALADIFDPVFFHLMGFHINRRTVQNVRAAGLELVDVERAAGVYRIVRARPAAGSSVGDDH